MRKALNDFLMAEAVQLIFFILKKKKKETAVKKFLQSIFDLTLLFLIISLFLSYYVITPSSNNS